jgi:hypothetical protein
MQSTAGLVASLFGLMNIFARGMGGFASDGHDIPGRQLVLFRSMTGQAIVSINSSSKTISMWTCEASDPEEDGGPSYVLLMDANSSKRLLLTLPLWSLVHLYDQAKWNNDYNRPLVVGGVSKSEVLRAAQCATNFDWTEFDMEFEQPPVNGGGAGGANGDSSGYD